MGIKPRRKNGKESVQKSKGKQRGKGWHRGDGEDIRWQRAMEGFPKLDINADPSLSVPKPLRRGPGPTNRGESL